MQVSAQAELDNFSTELLALAYEFDRFFPGLLDDFSLKQTLESVLPARIQAAQNAHLEGSVASEFSSFLEKQSKKTREHLTKSDSLLEAASVFSATSDALYFWLRQHSLVDPENISLRLLISWAESAVVCHDGVSGPWVLPHGLCLNGESVEEAALRIISEQATMDLSEDNLGGVLAQGYTYDKGLQRVLYLQVDCSREPVLPARCRALSWEDVPQRELEDLFNWWQELLSTT
jgi:hypothetical protein